VLSAGADQGKPAAREWHEKRESHMESRGAVVRGALAFSLLRGSLRCAAQACDSEPVPSTRLEQTKSYIVRTKLE